MPFGIVAYAFMLFCWTTFLETAVYNMYNSVKFCFISLCFILQPSLQPFSEAYEEHLILMENEDSSTLSHPKEECLVMITELLYEYVRHLTLYKFSYYGPFPFRFRRPTYFVLFQAVIKDYRSVFDTSNCIN